MEKKNSSNRPCKAEFGGIAQLSTCRQYEMLLFSSYAMAENFGLVIKNTTV